MLYLHVILVQSVCMVNLHDILGLIEFRQLQGVIHGHLRIIILEWGILIMVVVIGELHYVPQSQQPVKADTK